VFEINRLVGLHRTVELCSCRELYTVCGAWKRRSSLFSGKTAKCKHEFQWSLYCFNYVPPHAPIVESLIWSTVMHTTWQNCHGLWRVIRLTFGWYIRLLKCVIVS